MPLLHAIRPLATSLQARSSALSAYRYAQTAPKPDPEVDHTTFDPSYRNFRPEGASPHASSSSQPSQPNIGKKSEETVDRKGKGRARPDGDDTYRFPMQGRDGGSPDPFEVLGLKKDCSTHDIKQSYYRLALLLHPDSSHPSASPDHFATLHRAYRLLSTPRSRQAYQHSGSGWSYTSTATYSDPEYDQMRAEIIRRAKASAESSGFGGRPKRGSDAWGAYGLDGKWRPFPEAGVGKNREPSFIAGTNYYALSAVTLLFIAWIQYHRWDMVMETRLSALDSSHENASHALQAARREAKMYGAERRAQIKRRLTALKTIPGEGDEADVDPDGQDIRPTSTESQDMHTDA